MTHVSIINGVASNVDYKELCLKGVFNYKMKIIGNLVANINKIILIQQKPLPMLQNIKKKRLKKFNEMHLHSK